MSTYSDLLARLRKKTGPINLSEIVELLEEQAFPEGTLGPGSVERSVVDKLGETVSVKDFGAVGDGVTDDRPAFQAAVDYLKTSEAKTRRLLISKTAAGYYINGFVNLQGCHNLLVDGEKSLVTGGRIGTWNPGGTLWQQVPARYLTGRYRPGQRAVTMSGSGEATSAIPVAGNYVLIKTGDVTGGQNVPLCELNLVTSVVDNTVNLAWPLNHFYSDFGDGEVFGIAVIDSLMTVDLTIRNLHLHNSTNRPSDLLHVLRCSVQNCHFSGNGAIGMRGRFFDFDITADIAPNWPTGYRPYALAIDGGASDFSGRVKATSSGLAIVHLHESLANGHVDVDIQCGETDDGGESWGVVSLLGCNRNVHVRGTIINSPAGPAYSSNVSTPYAGWGNVDCSIELATYGKVNGRLVEHNGASTATGAINGILLVKGLHAGGALPTTSGTGSGWAASAKMTDQVTLVAASGAAASSSTEDGETVWTCADSASQGVQCEQDIPAGDWTHAMFTAELESVDAAAAGDVVWLVRPRTTTAGRSVSFTGTQDFTYAMATGKAGATTFLRAVASLGKAGRVGFSLIRNGAGGSDTLAGAVKIRRAWVEYFKTLNGTSVRRAAGNVRSTAVTLAASDNDAVYVVTGAVTVSVPTASTLAPNPGDIWRCDIIADGNTVTIDGAGSSNISLATGHMCRLAAANGKVWAQDITLTDIQS